MLKNKEKYFAFNIRKISVVFYLCACIRDVLFILFISILFCSGSCRFEAAVLPPVRVFLFVAVWAPSALVLLSCYVYVYLVARAHARAIYTVELSFRHQTQTLVLPRYGQTLAVTVGAFLILWLPFQVSEQRKHAVRNHFYNPFPFLFSFSSS